MARWRTGRDPRIALLMVVLGVGDVVVSQVMMWAPEASVPMQAPEPGIQVIRFGDPPPPPLPSPLLVASTVGGLILLAGGAGAWMIARAHAEDEPVVAGPDPAALVAVPPPPEDPLAMDPELRALVERHEAGQRPLSSG